MNPALQRYLEAATGLTNLTAARAEQLARQLVRSGEAAGDQLSELVDDLLERQRRNREALSELIRSEALRVARSMGFVTADELERLRSRIAELEAELSRVERTAEAAAEAAPADTGPVEQSAASSTTATRSGKKSTAKRSTAKKTTAKKAAAKKSSTKKATARRSTAKKATAKKAAAKKATAKKASARKSTAKKATGPRSDATGAAGAEGSSR